MFEFFAGNNGVINQFLTNHFAQVFVIRQLLSEAIVVGEVFFIAHAMHENHFFKLLIHFRIFGDAQERRDTGTG